MMIEILKAGEAIEKYGFDQLRGRPVIACVSYSNEYPEMARGVISTRGEPGTFIAFCFKYVCRETGLLIEIGVIKDEEFTLFDSSLFSVVVPGKTFARWAP